MVQLGVTQIPQQYILKRWSRDAETTLNDQTNQETGQQCEMSDDAKMKMRFAVMCAEMNKLAREACKSEDGRHIATSHMKTMKAELAALKRNQQRKEAKDAAATMSAQHTASQASAPPATAPAHPASSTSMPTTVLAGATHAAPQPTDAAPSYDSSVVGSQASNSKRLRDPPISSTKGRKKTKAYKHPLDVAVKERKTCRLCGSKEHDARTCKKRTEGVDPTSVSQIAL